MQCVSCMIRITDDTLLFFPFVSILIQINFDTFNFFAMYGVTIMNRNKNVTLIKKDIANLFAMSFHICFILASCLLGVDTSYNRVLLFQEVLYAFRSLRFHLYRAQRFG